MNSTELQVYQVAPNLYGRVSSSYGAGRALALRDLGQQMSLDLLGALNETFEFNFKVRLSMTLPKVAMHFVGIDTEATRHFKVEALRDKRVTDALSDAVQGRPVVALHLPGLYNQLGGTTLVYAVLLNGMPQTETPTEIKLPAVANLDLSAIAPGSLMLPVGMTAKGALWIDLKARDVRRHILAAGETRSGKSSWEHSAIAALVSRNTPTQLRIALLDPKGIEFPVWARLPHLFGDIAVTIDECTAMLERIVGEMEERRRVMRPKLCTNLEDYNAVVAESERLPYLLVFIDEALDLATMKENANFMRALRKLAITGLAFGVVLILATQHVIAVDGLERAITLNLKIRLAWHVMDANAARAAGCPGAEKIPAQRVGRLIAQINGVYTPAQSFWLDQKEREEIAQALAVGQLDGGTPVSLATDDEMDLLRWALAQPPEPGGRHHVTVKQIRARTGAGDHEARRIVAQLTDKGFVEIDRHYHRWPALTDLAAQVAAVRQNGRVGWERGAAAELPNLPNCSELPN